MPAFAGFCGRAGSKYECSCSSSRQGEVLGVRGCLRGGLCKTGNILQCCGDAVGSLDAGLDWVAIFAFSAVWVIRRLEGVDGPVVVLTRNCVTSGVENMNLVRQCVNLLRVLRENRDGNEH